MHVLGQQIEVAGGPSPDTGERAQVEERTYTGLSGSLKIAEVAAIAPWVAIEALVFDLAVSGDRLLAAVVVVPEPQAERDPVFPHPRCILYLPVTERVDPGGGPIERSSWFHTWIDGLQATTRFSGRLSLLIFSLIFLLHPHKKSLLETLLSRNYFLFFAVAHGIHLIELLSFVSLSGTELVPYRVAGGFLAYVLIFLMPWVKFRQENKKISDARFNALATVYLFYAWFIFFMTYIARLNGSFDNADNSRTVHVLLMGWVCVMLAIKLIGVIVSKSKSTE